MKILAALAGFTLAAAVIVAALSASWAEVIVGGIALAGDIIVIAVIPMVSRRARRRKIRK